MEVGHLINNIEKISGVFFKEDMKGIKVQIQIHCYRLNID